MHCLLTIYNNQLRIFLISFLSKKQKQQAFAMMMGRPSAPPPPSLYTSQIPLCCWSPDLPTFCSGFRRGFYVAHFSTHFLFTSARLYRAYFKKRRKKKTRLVSPLFMFINSILIYHRFYELQYILYACIHKHTLAYYLRMVNKLSYLGNMLSSYSVVALLIIPSNLSKINQPVCSRLDRILY